MHVVQVLFDAHFIPQTQTQVSSLAFFVYWTQVRNFELT